MIHELKTWPEFWKVVASGEKPFEVRKADRPFSIGDTLRLLEYCPKAERYIGGKIEALVTYVLPGPGFGVKAGYCVMGLRLLVVWPAEMGNGLRSAIVGLHSQGFSPRQISKMTNVTVPTIRTVIRDAANRANIPAPLAASPIGEGKNEGGVR